MKKITVYNIAWIIAATCCIASFFKAYGNYQDIPGTVIAKSDCLKSRYKSTKVYTEYIFAIHPDDNSLSDFDIEVPLHNYVKFNVGDKVVFYDENINKYLKDPKWYEKDEVWATISVALLFIVAYFFLIQAIIEHYRLQGEDELWKC